MSQFPVKIIISILSVVLIGGCATNYASKSHYTEKEKIASETDSRLPNCPSPEARKNGTFLSQYVPLLIDGEKVTTNNFREFSESYAKEVSYQPETAEIGEWSCWYGDGYGHAKIGFLKDPTKTWIWLSKPRYDDQAHVLTAHQCAYSNSPGKLTTDNCPSKEEMK